MIEVSSDIRLTSKKTVENEISFLFVKLADDVIRWCLGDSSATSHHGIGFCFLMEGSIFLT